MLILLYEQVLTIAVACNDLATEEPPCQIGLTAEKRADHSRSVSAHLTIRYGSHCTYVREQKKCAGTVPPSSLESSINGTKWVAPTAAKAAATGPQTAVITRGLHPKLKAEARFAMIGPHEPGQCKSPGRGPGPGCSLPLGWLHTIPEAKSSPLAGTFAAGASVLKCVPLGAAWAACGFTPLPMSATTAP
jgi:hypothetical protein